jgi:hypothetical protein
MKRLIFAYLIGLAACFISVAVVNRPTAKHVSFLYAALLGISSTAADVGNQRAAASHLALAAALVSLLFVLAEALRSRGSWLRWTGYGLWVLLAFASLFWFSPPSI